MARPKEVIDTALAEKAQAELKRYRDHQICIRLQAIASCAHQPLGTVASVMGVTRQTIWLWIKKFRSRGVEGLFDKKKGHNPAKLNASQRQQLAQWLAEGRNHRGEAVHWTLAKLAAEIEGVFSVKVGTTPLWRLVRSLGFRQKVPRPHHAQADPEAQEAFKKNRPHE